MSKIETIAQMAATLMSNPHAPTLDEAVKDALYLYQQTERMVTEAYRSTKNHAEGLGDETPEA